MILSYTAWLFLYVASFIGFVVCTVGLIVPIIFGETHDLKIRGPILGALTLLFLLLMHLPHVEKTPDSTEYYDIYNKCAGDLTDPSMGGKERQNIMIFCRQQAIIIKQKILEDKAKAPEEK